MITSVERIETVLAQDLPTTFRVYLGPNQPAAECEMSDSDGYVMRIKTSDNSGKWFWVRPTDPVVILVTDNLDNLFE